MVMSEEMGLVCSMMTFFVLFGKKGRDVRMIHL